MSTAIRSSFVDHTGLDGTGDAINGNEVDENPNVVADVLDGTLATDLAGAGTLDFVMTDTRAGIRLIDLSNAAAAIHEGLVLEWDPGDGGNLTDNSSGIGIDFKLPDDADTQTVFGSLNVVCVDDAAASTDGEFSFRVTAAGTDNVEQMTLSAAALTVTPPATITGLITATGGITSGSNIVSDTDSTDDLGTSSVRWANVYTDSIGDTGQDLTIAATTTNLPSGHVTDYAGADVVLTHSAGVLNVSTGALQVGGVAVSTGTNAVTSYTNTTDNRVITSGGTTVINGEANLTFDGTSLLEVRGPAANFGVVKISTAELTVVATDELGRIDFQAPLESSGSIGAAAGARISAVAEGTFSSTDNSTSLKFMTSSTAGVAERMRIDSAGRLLLGGTSTTSNWSPDAYINIEGAIPAITLRDTTPSADVWTLVNNNGTLTFANDTDNTQPMTITDGGNVAILGSLSKGSGSFKIRHPLPSRAGYDLVHSFIEGPQADLMYRGVVDLVGGEATINIDTAGRMTDGTFEALCTNVQSFTSNESNDDCVRGSVVGNVLTITSSNAASTARVSWMVIGERKDQHMIDTDWTDDDGRIITEPLTVVVK
jgi:hypothetical protein